MTNAEVDRQSPFPRGTWIFLVFQVAFLALAVSASVRRVSQMKARLAMPELREVPLVIRPRYDNPRVVTDQQLKTVLTKLRPRLRGEQPNINHADHALRFWGTSAQFSDPQCLSGEELRQLLVDHSRFLKVWGDKTRPLLIPLKDGSVRVRMQEGMATSSHEDHTLACLAEVGTPLSFPLRTSNGTTALRSLVEQALTSFSLNQAEYEWSGMVFALYVKPVDYWVSREGQEINFDRIAERLMRLKYHKGVCFGNHRLHTLTVMLRVDEQQQILSSQARIEIIDHLLDATKLLVKHQHRDGYWDSNWPYGKPSKDIVHKMRDFRSRRILATGHALEWWAFAPAEVVPPQEVVVRAGQWLARTISEMDDKQIKQSYTFLTHAGRALALWRGGFTADVWRRIQGQSQTKSKTRT